MGTTGNSVGLRSHSDMATFMLVSPKRCSLCHQEEMEQYSRSKHANILQIIKTIDNWLIYGMNNEIERPGIALPGTIQRLFSKMENRYKIPGQM
jgi:hypothetical protein